MMSDTMPGESVPIPLREDSTDPGLMALCHVLAHLSRTLGRDEDPARIAVLGGAAFRAYFFSPDDNHAFRETHPGVHWRRRTLSVDNYGLAEALDGHTGLNARRWGRLTGRALVELLRHEREAGRAVALRMADAPGRWVLAATSQEQGGELVAELAEIGDGAAGYGVAGHGAESGPEAGRPRAQGAGNPAGQVDNAAGDGGAGARLVLPLRDAEFLRSPAGAVVEVLTLRPTGEVASDGLAKALLVDVLGWAVGHQEIRHELVYDEEAFYAAGRLAWKRMAELSTSAEGRTTEGRAFLADVVSEYAAARQAAARWAEGEGPGDSAVRARVRERADGVATLLRELAAVVAGDEAPTVLPGLFEAVAATDGRLAAELGALRESLR